jgi:hypothetical protein
MNFKTNKATSDNKRAPAVCTPRVTETQSVNTVKSWGAVHPNYGVSDTKLGRKQGSK